MSWTKCVRLERQKCAERWVYNKACNLFSSKDAIYLFVCLFPDRFPLLIIVILQEFVAGLSLILRGSIYDRLNWAFHFYDLDKDGFITREVPQIKLWLVFCFDINIYSIGVLWKTNVKEYVWFHSPRRWWRSWSQFMCWWGSTCIHPYTMTLPKNMWKTSFRWTKTHRNISCT